MERWERMLEDVRAGKYDLVGGEGKLHEYFDVIKSDGERGGEVGKEE